MAFDPEADFSVRCQLQITAAQRKKLDEAAERVWAGVSASVLLRRMIEARWSRGRAPASGSTTSPRGPAEVASLARQPRPRAARRHPPRATATRWTRKGGPACSAASKRRAAR